MRFSDVDQIAKVIRSSGIATKTQRDAICQRIYDWFNDHRNKKYEEQPHGSDIRNPDGGES